MINRGIDMKYILNKSMVGINGIEILEQIL